jgi:hypothetical protein
MPERSANRRPWRRWPPKVRRSPRNRRRARPREILGRTVALVGAIYGLWAVFHAPELKVRRVEVVGADRLGTTRVAHLADVPLGRNIFRINLYRARLSVERDPLVAAATVSRALPDTVRILVKERRPVFLASHAGQLFEVDESGVLFRQVGRATPALPVLALSNVGPARVGGRLPPGIIKPALACLKLTAEDRLLLWKIKVDGPHELCLNMKVSMRPAAARATGPAGRNLQVRMGRPEDLAQKLENVRKILAGRPRLLADTQYLDVSCAGYPVYMAQVPASTTSAPARGGAAGMASTPAAPVTH